MSTVPSITLPSGAVIARAYESEELRMLAREFARQIQFSSARACAYELDWYRKRTAFTTTPDDAAILRGMVIDICTQVEEESARVTYAYKHCHPLRDFGRAGVKDEPANRAARAALMHSLPGRIMAGLEDLGEPLPADVDDAIDVATLERASAPCGRFALGAAIALLAIGFMVGVAF